MKIAEYIELVKQAETPQNGRIPTPPPYNNIEEPTRLGPPPVDPRINQIIRSQPVAQYTTNASLSGNQNKTAPPKATAAKPGTPQAPKNTSWSPEDDPRFREAMNAPAEEAPNKGGRPVPVDPRQTGAVPVATQPEVAYPSQLETKVPEGYLPQRATIQFPKEPKPGKTPWIRINPKGRLGVEFGTITKFDEIPKLNDGRTWPEWFKDFRNSEAYSRWFKHKWNNKWKYLKNFGRANVNIYPETANSFNAPLSPYPEISPLTGLFAFAGPMSSAKNRMQEIATEKAMTEGGLNLSEDTSFFDKNYRQYLKYYYPELIRESIRQIPNMGTELVSFNNPLAKLCFAEDMLVNMPLGWMGIQPVAPGLYDIDYNRSRVRSDQDYEDMKDNEYLFPYIDKINDQLYQYANTWADRGGAYIDPVLRHMPMMYNYSAPQIADLFGKKLKYRTNHVGEKSIDYQDLFKDILGSVSWDDMDGIPKLMQEDPTKFQELLNTWEEQAAMNGFTEKEIKYALSRANNTKYPDVNLLHMMALNPSEHYKRSWFRKRLNSADPKRIPRLRKKIWGRTMDNLRGMVYGPDKINNNLALIPQRELEENPEWTKQYLKNARIMADREVFNRLYPFFSQLGENEQISPEELAFIQDPKSIEYLINNIKTLAQKNRLNKVSSDDFILILNKYGDRDREAVFDTIQKNNFYRQLANMPYASRYVWLLKRFSPEDRQKFINTYYTDEKTKSAILDFLNRLSNAYQNQ